MTRIADHTLDLVKRVQADLTEVKREQLSQGVRLATIEQHLAANQVEIARLSCDVSHLKRSFSRVERRLDLVDA